MDVGESKTKKHGPEVARMVERIVAERSEACINQKVLCTCHVAKFSPS